MKPFAPPPVHCELKVVQHNFSKQKKALALLQNLRLIQIFSFHITHYPSSCFLDTDLSVETEYLPCQRCAELWYSRLNKMAVTTLKIHEACVWNVAVRPSKIFRPDIGMGCFLIKSVAVRESICYYYRILIYADLELHLQDNSTDGNGVVSVSENDFLTSALYFIRTVKTSKAEKKAVRIVAASWTRCVT